MGASALGRGPSRQQKTRDYMQMLKQVQSSIVM